ncbi:MAG: OmpA family protein [Saprospiraceae bacterium]|nr:OmpA family protein [Saprospiraceae bacterium]
MARIASVLGLLICFAWNPLQAQDPDPDNLIPNPGFEFFAAPPIGWYYRGKQFTAVMKSWSSPTAASPDAYGPDVHVPQNWVDKGFGEQEPHGGRSMAGLTLYGCDEGKPHCREYLQVRLKEPLVSGQKYAFECWVSHLPSSMTINKIGIAFPFEPLSNEDDAPLDLIPTWETSSQVSCSRGRWKKLIGSFTAASETRHMIVGNFRTDQATSAKAAKQDPLPFAYYYFDDFRLSKLPPILPVPVVMPDMTAFYPQPGMLIRFKDIYFDWDQDLLLPAAYPELNKLVMLLHRFPEMSIEVIGHTDIQGSDWYNLNLSKRRAQTVIRYLEEKQVDSKRLKWSGKGARQPIADNATEEGRRKNRRVEFLIVNQ